MRMEIHQVEILGIDAYCTKLGSLSSMLLENHHIVPVYDFFVLLRAELLLNFGRFESFDPY
jgi:hypothetical protein